MPRVSIGLPVYNGEKYLEKALDSILNQSYKDFELIISDNASTDGTKRICESYLNKDNRIRYYRSDNNMGAAWNFNRVFQLSSGKYFKWAAHDDVLTSDFLLRCVEVMDKDPSIVLCHSKIQIINEKEEVIKDHPHSSDNINKHLTNISCCEPHLRFADLISYAHPCIEIFGLLRPDILSQTPLIAGHIGSDRNLLAELGLHGRFYRVQEYLFFSRMHEDRSIKIMDRISITRWFDAGNRSRMVFPKHRNCYEYFKSVQHTALSFNQRLHCYFHLCKWILTCRKRLITDISLAVKGVSPEWFLILYRCMKNLNPLKK